MIVLKVTMNKSKKSRYGLYGVGVYLFSFGTIVLIGTAGIVFGFANHQPIFVLLGIVAVLYGIISTSGWYIGRYVIPGKRGRI
jgi:hypothetical protein